MVFVVTFDRLKNVREIITELCNNKSLKDKEFHVTVGVSENFQRAINCLPDSVTIIKLPRNYYWARSLKYLVRNNRKEYDTAVHLNDDIDPIQLRNLDFDLYFNDDQISFGEFKDGNGDIIFGGYRRSFLKERIVEDNVEMFNANIFVLPKKVLIKSMPVFTFQHAYLDFVLSYRAIKNDSVYQVTKIPWLSANERKEDRYLIKKHYRSTWYSRANPVDGFFYCIYTHQFVRAPLVLLYLTMKAIKKALV